jgi:hydrogenase maturation protease
MTYTATVVVIGIGSPFGADTLGWQVVEQLKSQQPSLNNNVRLETCDRPGTLLLDYMKGARKAILVDAIEGGTPGNVRSISKESLLQHATLKSSHQIGVAETLALGEKLCLIPHELLLMGIEVGNSSVSYHTDQQSIQKILLLISNEIEQ